MWILRLWVSISKSRAILKEEWPTGAEARAIAKRDRRRRFFFAAVEMWHAMEAVSNSRHKSWYIHNWALVLPRQIGDKGDIWQASTAANEFRGARITRTRAICWRPCATTLDGVRKVKRGDRIETFKQTYKSNPMEQMLRSLAAREERANDFSRGGKAAARMKASGRSTNVKIETSAGIVASSMDAFLAGVNRVAGMGQEV